MCYTNLRLLTYLLTYFICWNKHQIWQSLFIRIFCWNNKCYQLKPCV